MPPLKSRLAICAPAPTLKKTFQSGDRVPDASLDYHNCAYLYTDGDFYHFMDNETYDQPAIKGDIWAKAPVT